MTIVLSTDSVAPNERLAFWHDVVSRTFGPHTIETAQRTAFSGSVTTGRLGSLELFTVDADPESVSRTSHSIVQGEEHCVSVGIPLDGPGFVTHDGRQARLVPGDLVLYDSARPVTLQFPERYRIQVVRIPRDALAVSDQDLRGVTGITICGREGLGRLVSTFLANLPGCAGEGATTAGQRIAVNAVDVLHTLIAQRVGSPHPATDTQSALILSIRDFIDRHLSDCDLVPATIAAAHHISVRHLHNLFQNQGTTVTRWILQRRLEECRRELARSPGAIAAVAHQWGFRSPSHFSTAFKTAYGTTPRAWQKQHGRPHPGANT
ncbi:helix-turn-helix domain-containing protein [Streptantibioticus ferralitis]|uniref:Helix-turn-helix domain-containing protein n=1 Tax=Streptantibioticus ferralitis TaxID=236510 RepID=A0ABT5ZAK8_9ACTN|nr:helix-turn-helix domain-containing protein [Streptantibioticus ferralitis]MDF2260876.1 helix-turn-helix domain-containing protein [Streptantibioticus ferralitis]